jgi:outer membrane murein-binding lipoprotein Lpp
VHILSDDDPIFDNPTGAVLTVGSIAKLSQAAANLNKRLDELRADLDAMKAHRANEDAAKAASEAFRKSQQ